MSQTPHGNYSSSQLADVGRVAVLRVVFASP
jgi:hypothetical protein